MHFYTHEFFILPLLNWLLVFKDVHVCNSKCIFRDINSSFLNLITSKGYFVKANTTDSCKTIMPWIQGYEKKTDT